MNRCILSIIVGFAMGIATGSMGINRWIFPAVVIVFGIGVTVGIAWFGIDLTRRIERGEVDDALTGCDEALR